LVLQPLKEATKRLEGRSKSGRFSAIYEVIPVFEYLLDAFKEHVRPFEDVDYEQYDAPEDHLADLSMSEPARSTQLSLVSLIDLSS
jgi:hypothetical protein